MQKRTKITTDIENKIIDLRKQGLAIYKIGKILNINDKTVYKYCKKYGIPNINIKINSNIKDQIFDLLNDGKSTTEIANFFKLKHSTILRFLVKNKVFKIGKNYSTRLTLDQEKKIKDLAKVGYGRYNISKLLNISESTVRTFCRNLNIQQKQNIKINKEIGQKIIKYNSDGYNTIQIGKKLEINKTSISKFLKKNNIIIKRQPSEEQKQLKKIRKTLSNSIHRELRELLIKNDNNSVFKYLPYSIKELKEHLEKQFEPWMNWNNWGQYRVENWDDNDISTWKWQIDHIIPLSEFKYSSIKDFNFQKCWSINNLRPYSAKQNIIDGAKKTRHFKIEII